MDILGVYLVDLGNNTGGEINGKRYCIVISQVSKKDNTLLVVPITGKKAGTKYRGGFTIDNKKYFKEPTYEKGFAKVRKIREIDKNRVISDLRFNLDEDDTKLLIDSIKNVMPFIK